MAFAPTTMFSTGLPIAENNPVLTGVMLAGLAAVILFLLMRANRSLLRSRDGQASPAPVPRLRSEPRGQHFDVPAEALQWDVQMHETARELSAQLDSKMIALQALVAEADRAAARLEAALERSPDATAEAAPAGNLPNAEPPVVPPRGAEAEANPPADRPTAQQRKDEVYTLADYGFEPSEIARRTGMPLGEVQLILTLRGR